MREMNETRCANETAPADEGGLDPQEAATLLEQTRRRARRQFEVRKPLLSLIGAAVILVIYGVVWFSVRGQHPYGGPSLAAIAVVYALVIVMSIAGGTVLRRATTGLGGRALPRERAYGAAGVVALVAVYVFMGALLHAGASHAIVYGIYPATAPLIVLGAFGAAIAAAREDWPNLGVALALIAIGAGSAFAGPAWVWAFAGVGCCIALLGHAAAQVWLRRPRMLVRA